MLDLCTGSGDLHTYGLFNTHLSVLALSLVFFVRYENVLSTA